MVALSGTSGGAICATLAWDGFVRGDPRLVCSKAGCLLLKLHGSERFDGTESLPINLSLA